MGARGELSGLRLARILILCWPGLLYLPSLPVQSLEHLTELTLEQLMNVNVSVSARRGERLQESSAAVYILKNSTIKRSGATSIPELLRLVPGVEITRIGKGKWGVGIRGFNGGIFTNRLLILVDGRSAFSPAKIGMFWDTLDTLIDDIDRIEVVRGPGTALWGGNAFNGVINIVTKDSRDTVGGKAYLGAGNEERWFGAIRYGKALGRNQYGRVYFKSFERDDSTRPDGSDNYDQWTGSQGGFRLDFGAVDQGATSLQFNIYEGNQNEELILPAPGSGSATQLRRKHVRYSGMNFLAHWEKQASDKHNLRSRFTADHSTRDDLFFDLEINSYDLDLQHDFKPTQANRLLWGLAYRLTKDNLQDQYIRYSPTRREYAVTSGFAQYEHQLVESLRTIVGVKVSHNDFSGEERQPNMRMVWTPRNNSTYWLAVSDARRTPSRTEHDVIIDFDLLNPAVQLQIRGDEAFESEQLKAYEMGWRYTVSDRLSIDTALYYNKYDGLRTLEPGAPEPSTGPTPFIVPLVATNGAAAISHGGEVSIGFRGSPTWRSEFIYSYIDIDVEADQSADPNADNAERESPRHKAAFTSHWDLPRQVELSTTLRYVDKIEQHDIDQYTALDLRVSKVLTPNATLSLVGRNLLTGGHQEFVDRVVGTPRVEVDRSAYLQLMLKF